jgi:hypothetical protein
MPPDASGLYPAPPSQSQQPQNILSGDPLRLVGTLGELQRLKILQEQAPALGQIPGAQLSNTQLANKQAQLDLQNARRNAFGAALYGSLAGRMATPDAKSGRVKPLTADDVHNEVVNISRQFDPETAALAGPAFIDTLLSGKGSIEDRVRVGQASLLPTPTQMQPTEVGVTTGGQPIRGTPIQFNAAATQGGVVTQPPAGSTESANAMQADLIRAGNYSNDIFPLKRALDIAKSLGPGGMGPGTEGRQKFESYVYSLMPQLVPKEMQDKIKNYAELEKYLVNNTQNRAQNLGPHTNEGLATAVTGSPNVHINDLAGVDLIKAQLALRKMEHAQTMQAAKAGPVNYTNEKPRISAQLDPRAFHIENMEPAEIARLQKTLKGPERARFNASLRAGIDSGVIIPPGQ